MRRGALGFLAVLAAILSWPASAAATSPGTNGEIFYMGGAGLLKLDPRTGESDLVATGFQGSAGVAGDGETVAYARSVPQQGSEQPGSSIHVASVDGSAEREVVFRSGSPLEVEALSPDGETIAYIGDRAGSGLFSIGADGLGMRQVTSVVNDQQASFSPDGTKVVFSRLAPVPCLPGSTGWSVWIANADGTGARPLVAPSRQNAFEPTFTPDGRKVVYVRTHGPEVCDEDVSPSAVHSVRVSGKGDHLLTKPSHQTRRMPIPSPDGKRLLLMGDRRLLTVPMRGQGRGQWVPGSGVVGNPLAWATAP